MTDRRIPTLRQIAIDAANLADDLDTKLTQARADLKRTERERDQAIADLARLRNRGQVTP